MEIAGAHIHIHSYCNMFTSKCPSTLKFTTARTISHIQSHKHVHVNSRIQLESVALASRWMLMSARCPKGSEEDHNIAPSSLSWTVQGQWGVLCTLFKGGIEGNWNRQLFRQLKQTTDNRQLIPCVGILEKNLAKSNYRCRLLSLYHCCQPFPVSLQIQPQETRKACLQCQINLRVPRDRD